MVKTRMMVLEERIAYEMQRLKLKLFGDQFLENLTHVPVPSTYQGMLENEAAEAEEDFYYRWRLHHIVLIDEQHWVCFCILAVDKVTTKESLLDIVTQEEIELEAVLENLCISRKMRVNSRVDNATRLMKGICLGVKEERAELKRKKVKLERNLARLKSDLSKERKRLEALKASQVVEINKLQAEVKVDLVEMVAECDRLGHHLMSKGYSENEVDTIKADTYVKEDEEEETEDVAVGIVNGLDGVSPQMVYLPRCIMFSQAELQVELESARLREDEARECNQEFAKEFDRMREANKDREDLYMKVYIKKIGGKFKLADGRFESDLAWKTHEQKPIQFDLANSKSELGRLKKKLVDKDNELKGARDDLSASEVAAEQLTTTFTAKDLEFRMLQRKTEIVIKGKEELLKKIPDLEELNKEIEILRAQVVDLEANNRAESAKADKFFLENISFTDLIKRELASQKSRYKRLEDRLRRSRMIFSHSVITQALYLELLGALIAYFVEDVKRLELERDTLFDLLRYLFKDEIIDLEGTASDSFVVRIGQHMAPPWKADNWGDQLAVIAILHIYQRALDIGRSDCFHVMNPTTAYNPEIMRFGIDHIEDDVDCGWSYGNRLFSDYIGLDTMMAIMCKTLNGVKALETYDKEGQINKSTGLHMLGPSIGRHMDGRYVTRSEIQLALPCISEGALSLDGGMVRSNGVFTLGNREMVHLVIDGTWQVFMLQRSTPRNDFCRIAAKNDILLRLINTLHSLNKATRLATSTRGGSILA
ncbi:hypothetical protein GIB67_024477 [Kingdonia uniflora]|uniref:Uncharacterized protein n=1 Tax=Kingdonia uniflora TaxID=39325 RepID=A0A7J7LNY4_9MAGN|nr:hypothetical protein GIB67_024477 [Kingdonia uniflora]